MINLLQPMTRFALWVFCALAVAFRLALWWFALGVTFLGSCLGFCLCYHPVEINGVIQRGFLNTYQTKVKNQSNLKIYFLSLCKKYLFLIFTLKNLHDIKIVRKFVSRN